MRDKKQIKDFMDMDVWKIASELSLDIYKITKTFPEFEKYALADQLRRAAVSVTSNIAEGFGRESYADKKNFYCIARASLTEVQSQLITTRNCAYITFERHDVIFDKSVRVHKMLNALISKIRTLI